MFLPKMDKEIWSGLEDPKSENEISIIEMDEMHTYIGNKKILLDLNCR